MIKALFFDLDGTLLTSSKHLSYKTRTALKKCKDKGIKVFPATGRPPLLTKMLNFDYEEDEILKDGGVFYNGGCICCNNEKRYTFLPEEAAIKSIELINSSDEVNLAVQMADEEHSFRFVPPEGECRLWGVGNDELVSYDKLKYKQIIKIVVFSPWDSLPGLYKKLTNAVSDEANLYLTGTTDFRSIDVVNKGINKKLAIDRLLDIYGFDHDEAAVFGDDFNDIEMLSGFNNSIAMGNACNEVKSYAKHVTLCNDEDGIHYALKNILKLI